MNQKTCWGNMVYEPREDSLLLRKCVRKYAKGKVLDVGAGLGIQAKTALDQGCDVIAVDNDPAAVKHAKEQGINCVQSDLFENIKGKFDIIIFNPPYLPEHDCEDPKTKNMVCGGKKGNELLERFLKEAKTYLKEKGKMLVVWSSLTPNMEKICDKYQWKYEKLAEESFFYEKIYVFLLTK